MAIDLNTLLESQYSDYTKRKASLSDRLAEIDAYAKTVRPQVVADTVAVPRAELERPIDVRKSQLVAGGEINALRESAAQDLNNNEQLFNTIINGLRGQQTNGLDELYKTLQIKKLANDLGKKEDVFTSLSPTVSKDLSGYSALLKDLASIKQGFSGRGQNGMLGDIMDLTSGPIVGNIPGGEYLPGGNFRAQLDILGSQERKDLYGSAFTDTERRESQFLPSSKKSETQNVQNIDALYNRKINEALSRLTNAGIKDPEDQQQWFNDNGIPVDVAEFKAGNTSGGVESDMSLDDIDLELIQKQLDLRQSKGAGSK
jgi:hypothetical protein